MSLSARFKNTADRLLNKFDERESGQKINIRRLTGDPVWDSTLGQMVFPNSEFVEIVGVVTSFDLSLVNDNTIQGGDLLIKITADVAPSMSDKIIIDNDEYSIVSIDPVRYTNTTILYSLQVRQ